MYLDYQVYLLLILRMFSFSTSLSIFHFLCALVFLSGKIICALDFLLALPPQLSPHTSFSPFIHSVSIQF